MKSRDVWLIGLVAESALRAAAQLLRGGACKGQNKNLTGRNLLLPDEI